LLRGSQSLTKDELADRATYGMQFAPQFMGEMVITGEKKKNKKGGG
jgi:hypothetical protein